MTNFEHFKSMSLDEFAEFLDKHGMYDNTPWMDWWDTHYCSQCESVMLTYTESKELLGMTPLFEEREYEGCYCEVYNKCRFFPDKESDPDNKDIIKLWLNAEGEENV